VRSRASASIFGRYAIPLHRIDIVAHQRHRIAIGVADERTVAHAKPEHRARLLAVVAGLPPMRNIRRRVLPDIEYAGGDDDAACRRQQELDVIQHGTIQTARYPDRAEAKLVEFRRRFFREPAVAASKLYRRDTDAPQPPVVSRDYHAVTSPLRKSLGVGTSFNAYPPHIRLWVPIGKTQLA
jgi:hypothetical protein